MRRAGRLRSGTAPAAVSSLTAYYAAAGRRGCRGAARQHAQIQEGRAPRRLLPAARLAVRVGRLRSGRHAGAGPVQGDAPLAAVRFETPLFLDGTKRARDHAKLRGLCVQGSASTLQGRQRLARHGGLPADARRPRRRPRRRLQRRSFLPPAPRDPAFLARDPGVQSRPGPAGCHVEPAAPHAAAHRRSALGPNFGDLG